MAALSLILLGMFGAVCVGWRSLLHYRQTGQSPFRSGGAGHGAIAVIALAVPLAAGDVLDATGSLGRVLHGSWLGFVGAALAVSGIVATTWAQLAMGASWRIGVDETERTALVTGGPYRQVRNPIYTAMIVFA